MYLLKEAFKYGVIFIFSTLSLSQGLAGNIRDNIEDRRYLRCGIEERPDFLGVKNPLNAMAITLCEALTLVIFRDPKALKLVSIPTGKSDDFLDNRSVDLVMLGDEYEIAKHSEDIGSTTLFINNLSVLNLGGYEKPDDLSGQKICSLKNLNKSSLGIFSQKNQLSFSVLSYETPEILLEASLNHACKAVALPRIEMAIFKEQILKSFPEASEFNFVSGDLKLSIVVSEIDQEWHNITKWFAFALLESERLNINSGNVDLIASTTTNNEILGLLGLNGAIGFTLGLDKQWFYRALKAQGNYQEIYNRHFGDKSPVSLSRGPNQLKSKGGLLNFSVLSQTK